MRNQKGITLIALVITIIVLLILAGVSIAMLTGDNGLLSKATEGADASAVSGAKDEVSLIYQECLAELLEERYTTNTTSYNLVSNMNTKITSMDKHGCEVTVNTTAKTITITKGSYTTLGTVNDTAKHENLTWSK